MTKEAHHALSLIHIFRAVVRQHAAVNGGVVTVALLKEVEHAAARAEIRLLRAVAI